MKNTTPDPIELALIGLLALALALRPLLVALVALVLLICGYMPQEQALKAPAPTPAPAGPALALLAPVDPVEVTAAAPVRKPATRKPRTMKPAPVAA